MARKAKMPRMFRLISTASNNDVITPVGTVPNANTSVLRIAAG